MNKWMKGWILNTYIKVGQQFYEIKCVCEKDGLPDTNVTTTTKDSSDRTLLFKALVVAFLSVKTTFF